MAQHEMSHSAKLIILLVIFFEARFFGEVFAGDGKTEKFIKEYNYPVETHHYETDDGYILTAHRIPHGLSKEKPKRVALMVHGMGGSGENYITIGPPDALGFYLADKGYDVWLFNARGSMNSRKHRSLNPNTERKKFWNFSWHEIGTYDLPATINYILNVTGADGIFYVGHSQGTTTLFVLLSEVPEMNDKIKAAALLAPSASLHHTQSPLLILATRFLELGQKLLPMLNWYEMLMPNGNELLNRIVVPLCSPKAMHDICMDFLYVIAGTESGLVNKTLLPIMLQFTPSGFAVKQMFHYAQVIKTGDFKQFDYGPKKNLKMYNDTKPPLYKFPNMKVPLALFYAIEDPYSNPTMVEELRGKLPNIVLDYQVPVPKFNHLDYILAYNVKEFINDRVLEVFDRF
ncbi:unnamed protein product [Ceutorhynchus assimilis]|uniref:Lipase n=1 Tax=Ceutorhynchus assimilis TaxID=467358 RepID=A0A9P0DLD2_9CUCU|nr:unnamed protein product [Ceutorhynchus assimilis]